MSIDAVKLAALRGGRLQWTCQIAGQDFTSYLVDVEGLTKRVTFDYTPTTTDVTVRLAGCQPTLSVGDVIVIGLNKEDTFDVSHALWRGTLNEITELARVVELQCSGSIADCNKDYQMSKVNIYAQTPRNMYSMACHCFSSPRGTVPSYTDSFRRDHTKIALPTSTLGGLSGVATRDVNGVDVYGGPNDHTQETFTHYDVPSMSPIIDFVDWKTFYGSRSEGMCRSKEPLMWHTKNLSVNFYMQARCDSARAWRCYWPLGYDQYFDAWLTVYWGGQNINMNTTIRYDGNTRKNHGWWHYEGQEVAVRDRRQTDTSGGWTVGAVIAGILGLSWGTTIAAGVKARQHELSKNARLTTTLTALPAFSSASWTSAAYENTGLSTVHKPSGSVEADATPKSSISEEVHFVDNNSVVDDPENEGHVKFTYEAHSTTGAGEAARTLLNTTFQYHGTMTYTHPDLSRQFKQWYPTGDFYNNLSTQYRISQKIVPATVNVTDTPAYSILPEVGQLAGVCAFEGANGVAIADLTPEKGKVYDIPLLPCNINTFAFAESAPLPTTADVQFRDAYGDSYTYSVPVDNDGTTESKASFTLCQGNFYKGEVTDGGSLEGWLYEKLDIASNKWSGSPGLLMDRITGIPSDLAEQDDHVTSYRYGMQVIDAKGLIVDAANVPPIRGLWTKDTQHTALAIQGETEQTFDLFTTQAYTCIEKGRAKDLDSSQPLLDIFPINQMVRAHRRVYSYNLQRKTYTATTSLAFAFCEPGTVVMAALPDYMKAESYLMLVTAISISEGTCTLTLCPLAPTSSYNSSDWEGMAATEQLIDSYYNRG